MSAQGAVGGFEYQISVSIWLALVFLFDKKACTVTVEPPSEEDLEVILANAKSPPGTREPADRFKKLQVRLEVEVEDQGGGTPGPINKLSVQIKSRSSIQWWTPSAVAGILEGKDEDEDTDKKNQGDEESKNVKRRSGTCQHE